MSLPSRLTMWQMDHCGQYGFGMVGIWMLQGDTPDHWIRILCRTGQVGWCDAVQLQSHTALDRVGVLQEGGGFTVLGCWNRYVMGTVDVWTTSGIVIEAGDAL